MRDDVVTGYEERFDFARRAMQPEQTWLLASTPRSGSTFFSHLIWATGCLGAPLEYLNFEPAGPHGFASASPQRQLEIWRSVLARRTAPNGVFGLKAFPIQLEALQRQNPKLVAEVMRLLFPSRGRARVVELRRRDRTAHVISYARALLSGVWRKEQETGGRAEPDYSSEAMAHADRLIARQEGAWRAMYRDLGIEPLVIWYEDVLADREKAIVQVSGYLGVALDPSAKVTIPAIERQSQSGAQVWAARHAETGVNAPDA